jgi:hypothetical protein
MNCIALNAVSGWLIEDAEETEAGMPFFMAIALNLDRGTAKNYWNAGFGEPASQLRFEPDTFQK